MSVPVSSRAGPAQPLAAAAISCCSTHESPTRAALALSWGWVGTSALCPGFCPARSGLSARGSGFGVRLGDTRCPLRCPCEPGPKPRELHPEKFLSHLVSAEPSRNTGWHGGKVLSVTRCPLGFPICPSTFSGAALGPRCPRTVFPSPGASLLPSPCQERSWDAGGHLEEGLPVLGGEN